MPFRRFSTLSIDIRRLVRIRLTAPFAMIVGGLIAACPRDHSLFNREVSRYLSTKSQKSSHCMLTGTALRFGLSGENFGYLIRPHRSPSRCTAVSEPPIFLYNRQPKGAPASRRPGKSSANVSPITGTCVPTRKRTAEHCSPKRRSACDCRRADITMSSALPEP